MVVGLGAILAVRVGAERGCLAFACMYVYHTSHFLTCDPLAVLKRMCDGLELIRFVTFDL